MREVTDHSLEPPLSAWGHLDRKGETHSQTQNVFPGVLSAQAGWAGAEASCWLFRKFFQLGRSFCYFVPQSSWLLHKT